jgi:RHH-type proline utilization regulon transcriptional repressor/proline dehydrogenase/delta 1-pyrroline-5-carboxylate dehydrogenase
MGGPGSEAVSETLVAEIGAELLGRAARARPAVFDARGLRGRLLAQALKDEKLCSALFRFIDVLPQLESGAEIGDHFRAYLGGHHLGGVWGRLLGLGTSPLFAPVVRASVQRFARNFLVEETPAAVQSTLAQLRRLPAAASFDAVGEKVLTEAEADRYLERNLGLLDCLAGAGTAAPNLSIKLSALTPRFDPIDRQGSRARVLGRLRRLMPRVQALGATLTVDMEHYDFKPLVIEVFQALLDDYPDQDWTPGIALQAYLHTAAEDVQRVVAMARRAGRRICLRLVKGAYWDTEVALALQRNWPVPVLLDKAATDAQYERLAEALFDARDCIFPALASHNVRTVSHAVAQARVRGCEHSTWEIQMLHGMADPLAAAVAATGVPLRVYVPTGDLITGIAYLIRRLVENTANTSILRHTWAGQASPLELLAPPAAPVRQSEAPMPAANTPLLDFSDARAQADLARALTEVRAQFGATYSIERLGGSERRPEVRSRSNPADPSEVLGWVEQADAELTDRAVERAAAGFKAWRQTPAESRVALCRRAADLLRQDRLAFAAWEVFEAGKNWREADADVAEAIDYLDYYAAQAESVAGWHATHCFPGERNHLRFEPRGVTAVIAPWNFPLAILAGMSAAALATGNVVIMKPAGPTQIVAWRFAELLHRAGFGLEVVQCLPGPGSEVGERLVSHPAVVTVAFTGSREIGLSILRRAGELSAGQREVKRAVCEMGGKNAIVVDRDADLDEAVSEALASAFGYQGQKCSAASRVVVADAVHDRFVSRLAQALDACSYGPPKDPQFEFGPVITGEAQRRIEDWISVGRQEARLFYRGRVPDRGFYVAPAIFTEVTPAMRIAREEIFGPVLSILRARDFEQALRIALDSDYALTGGVFSRLPAHIELARREYRVGNLYINRRITGARVGVQPFGGIGHSGTGIQAGGPDYIKQFMWSRVVSENTLRHGYVPPE